MMSSSNNSGYITVDQANKMLLKQNTVNTSRDPRAYSKVAIPPISTNLDTSDRTSGISSNSTNNSGASAYSMASGIPRNQLTSGQNQLTSGSCLANSGQQQQQQQYYVNQRFNNSRNLINKSKSAHVISCEVYSEVADHAVISNTEQNQLNLTTLRTRYKL